MGRWGTLPSNVIHDFVFSLAGHICVRKYNLKIMPGSDKIWSLRYLVKLFNLLKTKIFPDFLINTKVINLLNLYCLPSRIVSNPFVYVIAERSGKSRHERRAGRDAVWVEVFLCFARRRQGNSLRLQLLTNCCDLLSLLVCFFRGSKSSASLLIHLHNFTIKMDKNKYK